MWGWVIVVMAVLFLLLVYSLLDAAARADVAKPPLSIEISVEAGDLLNGLHRATSAIDYWIYSEVVRRGIARLLEGEEIVNW